MNIVSTRPDNLADSSVGANLTSLGGKATEGRLMSRRAWLVAAVSILIVGSMLRVHHLDLVPLHHDEGVNGFFLTRLFRTLSYQYNPENYHGPSLYYFALVSAYLLGLNTLAIRITTAVFGIATVWIILVLRKQVGEVGSLVGASLVAVSPGAVYLSRYFIHETLFVFFTTGVVVGLLRYAGERKLRDLMLASSSASLLLATKETSAITAAVLLIAAAITTIYMKVRRGQTMDASGVVTDQSIDVVTDQSIDSVPSASKPTERITPATDGNLRLGWNRDVRALDWGSAVAIGILLFLLFYSSFFVNPEGIADALKAFKFWARTGEQQHTHAWSTYLGWLWQEEAPLLVLAALGILVTLWAARNKFGIFASLWAVGLLAAYSLIPYKTPWLALNFIIPMAIAVSCAAEVVFSSMNSRTRIAATVVLLAALSFSAVQCIRLNFYHYDDDRYAYVYAHTQREFLGLVNDIEEAAAHAGTGKATAIAVTSPDYWPLPWYLRSYPDVGYFGKVISNGAAIVVGSEAQQQELDQTLGEDYIRIGYYALRPGVVLVLYTRRDFGGG